MTTALLATLLLAGPSLEVRVEGDGYLRIGRGARMLYANHVGLARVNGALGTSEGDMVLPRLPVPAGAIKVDMEGNITVGAASVGRLVLAIFPAGTRLTPVQTLFSATTRPSLANPGEGTAGVIRTSSVRSEAGPTAAESTGAVTINVPARSTVGGDQFTLGEIAAIDGDPALVNQLAAVGMGASPVLGTERGLIAIHLLSRIRLAGIDPKRFTLTVSPNAVVVREAQLISPERLVDAAREAVRTKLGINTPLVAVKSPLPVSALPGEIQIDADPSTATPAGVPVSITVRVGTRIVGTRSIVLLPEGGAVGVRVGETVRIRMICNGAAIELQGRATTGGWVGQTVNVQSGAGDPSHPTVLTGVVVEPGLVEVKA